MKKISFPFLKENSELFGQIGRPVAQVQFWASKKRRWTQVLAIVDSGADYTLLPKYFASVLDVDLSKDCRVYPTAGIGGKEKVFLLRRIPVRVGSWRTEISVGFLDRDDIPPLLGRQDFLNKMGVLLYKGRTTLIFS